MAPSVVPPEPPSSPLPSLPTDRRRRVALALLAPAVAAVLVGALVLGDPVVVAAGLALGSASAWTVAAATA